MYKNNIKIEKNNKSNIFDTNNYVQKMGKSTVIEANCPILMIDLVDSSLNMNHASMFDVIVALEYSLARGLDDFPYYWNEIGEYSIKNSILLINTGDGYAVALSNILPDDQILKISKALYKSFVEIGLKFRMGIAKEKSTIGIDLNGDLRLYGSGMTLATRVCDKAKDGQILVEKLFAEDLLKNREMPELQLIQKEFETKHGFKFNCYNLYDEKNFGIDI